MKINLIFSLFESNKKYDTAFNPLMWKELDKAYKPKSVKSKDFVKVNILFILQSVRLLVKERGSGKVLGKSFVESSHYQQGLREDVHINLATSRVLYSRVGGLRNDSLGGDLKGIRGR